MEGHFTVFRCVEIWCCFLYLGHFLVLRYDLTRIPHKVTLLDLISPKEVEDLFNDLASYVYVQYY